MESPAATPPTAPEPGKSGAVYALLLALLLPAGLFAQLADPLAGLLWTELFVFLVPAVVATAGANLDPRAWLRLRPPTTTSAGLAFLLGTSGWFLGSAVFAAARAVAPREVVQRFDLGRLFEGSPAEQAAMVAAAAVVAPLCEELAFRGYLTSALLSRHRPALAIGGSALLFALLHLDPVRAPSILVLGVIYGWLSVRTGSIWPGVIAHATNNAIAAALALRMPAGTGEAEPTLGMALLGVGAGAAGVALVAQVFRAAVPSAPAAGALPLRDPSTPSARFRLGRLPLPLGLAILAGWVSLGALLLALR
ncbi:MAG TPA: type II CAAX endopeptidase family protein [Anaeromyxobacteraceae bacterium]|nr:type II CAAX endopeptidase family protein [Anaeromyxobacteraceae bacterium]